MFGFRRISDEAGIPAGNKTMDIRGQVFDAATAQSLQLLKLESSPEEIRKVTRRSVRRLMSEVNRRREMVIDDADESDERGFCTIGNGVFPGSSLTTPRDANSFDTEDELIDYIDRCRRLAAFIRAVGIPAWRWFFAYWRSEHKPDAARDRMRFHRLKIKFLTSLQATQLNVDEL